MFVQGDADDEIDDTVSHGHIFQPKGESAGSKMSAFNVRGAHLVRDDFIEREIAAERLDGGGRSSVTVRVANFLPYTVLKILAFQDRHDNKDAYDLVFTLLNYAEGPRACGRAARASTVADHPQVQEAIALLEERFRDVDQDGPTAYAQFLEEPGDDAALARLKLDAVSTVQEFVAGLRSTG